MKKLLILLSIFAISCESPKTEVKYDFVYASTSPTGGIDYYTQTKYTIVSTSLLPEDDIAWLMFINQLVQFHDLEAGILVVLYYGHVFYVDNFWG